MDADKAAELRKPFAKEQIGLLPKITCKACSDSPRRECGSHNRSRCNECGNYITNAHLHLDYVGHAIVTQRLINVDPNWTWEPMSFGPDGLPAIDRAGNLWIRLTVCGVTRIGVGDGKNEKEKIGDAIRNAAMRFGVALDLWSKEELEDVDQHVERPTDQIGKQPDQQPPAPPPQPEPAAVHDQAVSTRNAVKRRILAAVGGDTAEAKRQVDGLNDPTSVAELLKLAEHLEQIKEK